MDLSIIVVNWKSIEFTRGCLASIQANVANLEYEVIVVDNHSEADACRHLPAAFPFVKVICFDENVGFARANNLGARHATGSVLLFLNPDTVVRPGAIETMIRHMEQGQQIGALGCKILNSDLSIQTSCIRPFPTVFNELLAVESLRTHTSTWSLWGIAPLYARDTTRLYDVDVLSGACMMIRRSAFEQVNGFSTEYFMYAEDTDLCYKVKRAGWKICYCGSAEIIHFGGQSSKSRGDGFADVMMRDSVFRLLRKFRGDAYATTYRVGLLMSAIFRVVLIAVLLILPVRLMDRDTLLHAFRKWRKIASWSVALEGWTRHVGSS